MYLVVFLLLSQFHLIYTTVMLFTEVSHESSTFSTGVAFYIAAFSIPFCGQHSCEICMKYLFLFQTFFQTVSFIAKGGNSELSMLLQHLLYGILNKLLVIYFVHF